MPVIHKYDVPSENRFTILLPVSAEVLTIQLQQGVPKMWVFLDPEDGDEEDREFLLVGTGQEFEDIEGLTYVGTFQPEGLVFHLFEIVPEEYEEEEGN